MALRAARFTVSSFRLALFLFVLNFQTRMAYLGFELTCLGFGLTFDLISLGHV